MKQAILYTVSSGNDQWLVLLVNKRADTICFLYGDEGPMNAVKDAVQTALIQTTGGDIGIEHKTVDLTENFQEDGNGWKITSPRSNSTYTAESEGQALRNLLASEPEGLNQFATKEPIPSS